MTLRDPLSARLPSVSLRDQRALSDWSTALAWHAGQSNIVYFSFLFVESCRGVSITTEQLTFTLLMFVSICSIFSKLNSNIYKDK